MQKHNWNIDHFSLEIIHTVDSDMVKSAVAQMKPNKNDAYFDSCSDMNQNAKDIFYNHLALILRQSLVHGKVPHILVLCMLMPLVKDNLGDITKNSNYRAIAGGCLVLKVLDLIILKYTWTDELQFAYNANTWTTACTVVDYFTRHGNPVYGKTMDMSEAFDMVCWKELFTTLVSRGIKPIFLRLLVYIYTNQEYTVK